MNDNVTLNKFVAVFYWLVTFAVAIGFGFSTGEWWFLVTVTVFAVMWNLYRHFRKEDPNRSDTIMSRYEESRMAVAESLRKAAEAHDKKVAQDKEADGNKTA